MKAYKNPDHFAQIFRCFKAITKFQKLKKKYVNKTGKIFVLGELLQTLIELLLYIIFV